MDSNLAGRIAGFLALAGVVAVVALALGFWGADSTDPPAARPASFEPPVVIRLADELTDIDAWLQSDVTSLGELRGDVVVVQFWTFGCYNCKNTLENLSELYERHKGENFEVVGVHAPEFDFESDIDNVAEAAKELGVSWPIAIDNNKTNFRQWQGSRRFWPRTYVLDTDGNIVFDHVGEGGYDELNDTVAYLLDQSAAPQ